MNEQPSQKLETAARIAGTLLFAVGMAAGIPAVSVFLENAGVTPWARPLCFIAAWLLIGGDVLLRAVQNIFRGKIFDENFLMTIATIGAFAIGEFPEGAAVMLFYQVGEACQELAVRRSRSSITSLMDLRPDYAMLKKDGEIMRVSPEEVRPGGIIVVRPGEKIALDGTVEEGVSFLDTSALTGESAPREVRPGSEALAGMVNQTALIAVRVTREAGESAAARILKLVKEAEDKKAPVENFITRFARYYTPAVVLGAAALAVIPPAVMTLAGGAGVETAAPLFSEWLRRALVFLVVSCPCALVVSIPLSFFGGIGGASKRGILVKGGNYLDALNRVDVVVFDKTGTLTKGFFSVAAVIPAPGRAENEVLRLAAIAESNSNHPIAVSIKREAASRGLDLRAETVSSSELAGRGVRHQLANGQILRAGSRALLAEEGIIMENAETQPDEVSAGRCGAEPSSALSSLSKPKTEFASQTPHVVSPVIRGKGEISPSQSGTYVYVAENGHCAGALVIADELKTDARSAVAALKKAGVKTVMLTGDSKAAAKAVAAEAGVDEFYAELLPWEKVDKLEELEAAMSNGCGVRGNPGSRRSGSNRNIVFVGDGINDAPVLARSGIGIAMGGLGSDAAIEAADVVLMTDEPGKIVEAMEVAARTQGVVRQNIVFSLTVKAALLVLGAMGMASLWMAVFGDVGVALIAVLNAARVYGIKPRNGGQGNSRCK